MWVEPMLPGMEELEEPELSGIVCAFCDRDISITGGAIQNKHGKKLCRECMLSLYVFVRDRLNEGENQKEN